MIQMDSAAVTSEAGQIVCYSFTQATENLNSLRTAKRLGNIWD